MRWEKVCNGACSEADLELLVNPFGIGAITQVFITDLFMFLPVGILSIPLSLIWVFINGVYIFWGILARTVFDTLTKNRPESDYTTPLNMQPYADFNIFAFIFWPFKAYLVVIEAFFIALLNYVQMFFAFIASVINIILIPFKIILNLIADLILRVLVIATIPFKILFAAAGAVWSIYRSLWEPILRILLYPFLAIFYVFLIVWESFWSFWGGIWEPFMYLV
jgi:hypothetical protein